MARPAITVNQNTQNITGNNPPKESKESKQRGRPSKGKTPQVPNEENPIVSWKGQTKIIDWSQLKVLFISGEYINKDGVQIHVFPDLKELAERYGINRHNLYIKSSKEGWSQTREILRSKLRDRKVSESAAYLLSESAQMDGAILASVKGFLSIVDRYRSEVESALEEADSAMDLLGEQGKNLESMVRVLEKLHRMAKAAYGEEKPTLELTQTIEEETKKKLTALTPEERDKQIRYVQKRMKELEKQRSLESKVVEVEVEAD